MLTDPVLVEVVRGGLVESVHRGRLVITGPGGAVEYARGAVDAPMYPRSANKPLQAVGMLAAGLDLDGELLALAGASHSGEGFHRDGVRRILGELDVSALQNVADYPIDEPVRVDWIRAGHGPESIAMNCSGKHAAMIRTCALNGWSIEDYLDPDHPVQRGIAAVISELAGEAIEPPAVDGCGAPLLAVSLAGVARAFGSLAAAQRGPERRVADAFREFPEWASGTRRDEAELHRAIPGLVCKAGAEGVHAAGLPDGRGIALKIDDGSIRGRAALMASALQRLGYAGETLDRHRDVPVLGGGRRVGELRIAALSP